MVDRLVYESKKSKVFRRQEDGSSMVTAVKVLNYEFPTPADIAQFHNEFDIVSGLKLPGIRGPLRKTRENNRHVLEMEWVDGALLDFRFVVDAVRCAIEVYDAIVERDAGVPADRTRVLAGQDWTRLTFSHPMAKRGGVGPSAKGIREGLPEGAKRATRALMSRDARNASTGTKICAEANSC